ncbi:MAG TPA: GntR family transcriptional regulator [Gemmatimonadaceae bacterium]|nr:GntR family transcriptional regulator [Gemmatimonadaceae bacterium]
MRPIERHTVTSMTRDAIRARILRGVYPAGEPLRQDAVAEQLGVSRIPVREALRLLEAEGLVTFNPHRGAVVSTLSLNEIQELFELRAQIESDLLTRAVANITHAQVDQAEEVLDVYDAALRRGQVADWGGLNWQFHSTLLAPANRPVTMGVIQRLHQHADRYARMQLALTHGESRASQEHRAIAAAVRRRNAKRAAALLQRHILGAGEALVAFLHAQQAPPATEHPAVAPRRQTTR